MKKLNLEQMENVEGGRFFGSSYSCGGADGTLCTRSYSVFWITWPINEVIFTGGCNASNCNSSTWE